MIIYNKDNTLPLFLIGADQDPYLVISSKKQYKNLDWINNQKDDQWTSYRVVEGNQIYMTPQELFEISEYGHILSKSQRIEMELISDLIPSHEEIQKAENTIEILELLSEVL